MKTDELQQILAENNKEIVSLVKNIDEDLKALKNRVDDLPTRDEMKDEINTALKIQKSEIKDEMNQSLKILKDEMNEALRKQKSEIIESIGEMLDHNVLPKFSEYPTRYELHSYVDDKVGREIDKLRKEFAKT